MSQDATMPPLPQHAAEDEVDIFGNSAAQRRRVRQIRFGVIVLIVAAVAAVVGNGARDYYHSLTGTIVQVGLDDNGSWADISSGGQVRRAFYSDVDVAEAWKSGDSYPFLANFVETRSIKP